MVLADSHRVFVQYFLDKGALNAAEVKRVFAHSLQKFDQQNSGIQLDVFVKEINVHLAPLHLEIKKGVCELTENNYYLLVNSANNEITLSASDYQANEKAYFKLLVSMIVMSEGSVTSLEALNAVSKVDKLSKNQAQDLLDRLVLENWLIVYKGCYYLAVKSVIELGHYIEKTYDVSKCSICKKLAVYGVSCSQCDGVVHLYCARQWKSKKCPEHQCKAEWTYVPEERGSQGGKARRSRHEPAE